MDPGRLRNLTFLMSLGGLWAGCFSDEGLPSSGTGPGGTTGGTTGDGATTEPASTTTGDDTTGGTTTTGEPLTSSTTTTTGEPLTSSTTTDVTTSDVTTTDGGTTTGTTGPDPDSQACVQYGAKYGACYPQYMRFVDEIVAYCSAQLTMGIAQDGPACGEALEEWYACIISLDCRQIDQEFNNPMFCAGPGAAIDNLCPSIDF